MESPKTNKLAIYRATAALLATIATLPEFTRLQPRRAAFLAKLEEIAALEAQHAEPLGSSLLERDRALEAMIDAILALASAARSQADAMLANQLDPLILPLRKTNPDFYARYQALCEVVARPGGRNTPSPGSHGSYPPSLRRPRRRPRKGRSLDHPLPVQSARSPRRGTFD